MNPWLALVLVGTVAAAASGLPALLLPRRPQLGERLSSCCAVLASALGLCGALVAGLQGGSVEASASWSLPGGSLRVGLDGLSALFLLPVFLVPGLAAIYGLGYASSGHGGRGLRVFQGLLCAGMALVVLARNGVLFLCGWELMALSAFLLIATDHQHLPTRRAAWVYLVATHLCTLCLVAVMALLAAPDGSLDWQPAVLAAMPRATAVLVFALALLGFGIKAGLMPVHVWLPAAHASAPSHVSAVLSGVMLKMGVYGLLRVLALLGPLPSGCGVVLLVLAGTTALLAVAATLAQSDLKRLLAYSSIDNLGIVLLGVGLWVLGRSLGRDELVVLGLGGGLFHALSHSLFKPLLFFGAGALLHATGTRELDQYGGLLRRLPRTGGLFLLGAAAISGLPLLNGFAGEFVLYLGLFATAGSASNWLALLGSALLAVLAMVGGLAVVAFVRSSAAAFLGAPRSRAAAEAHEAPASMTAPMAVLALLCLLFGLCPWLLLPLLQHAIDSCSPSTQPLAQLLPFGALSLLAVATGLALLLVLPWLRRRARRGATVPPVGTWDCGYVDASSPRLQYTASSMAQSGARMLGWTVRQRVDRPAPLELFAGARAFAVRALEPLLHGVLVPFLHRLAERCMRLRFLQRGKLQIYLLYIFVALLLLLAASAWAVTP